MKLQATEEALGSGVAPCGVTASDSNEPEPRFHCFHHLNIYIRRAWGNGSLRQNINLCYRKVLAVFKPLTKNGTPYIHSSLEPTGKVKTWEEL